MQVVQPNDAETVTASLRPVVILFASANILVTVFLLAVSIFQ